MLTAPVTVLQVLPASLDTSKVFAAAVSIPSVAVPAITLGVKLTALVETLLRLTVNTAAAPSATVGLLTDSVGISLSLPPVPVPSSLITPTPLASLMIAPLALLKVMLNASRPSYS